MLLNMEENCLIHIKSMNYRKHYAEVDIFKECIEELECILEILKLINKKHIIHLTLF